jgi:hypothetical protein
MTQHIALFCSCVNDYFTLNIFTFTRNCNLCPCSYLLGIVYFSNVPIYIQQDATLHSLFYLETALHVSGGTTTHHQERKQLSTASGICHTVTAICRYQLEELELV